MLKFFKGLFGPKSPSFEQYAEVAAQLSERLEHFLAVETYGLSVRYVQERFPNERPGPIGALTKLTVCGEGPNPKALEQSSPQERAIAHGCAGEILASAGHGFYWLPFDQIEAHVKSLTSTPEDIKAIGLTMGRQRAMNLMQRCADTTFGVHTPRIDSEGIRVHVLPLLLHVNRHDPNDPAVLRDLAQVYFTLQDPLSARRYAEAALDADPTVAEAWRLVGNGHLTLGDDANARRCYERALELDPSLEGARVALNLLP